LKELPTFQTSLVPMGNYAAEVTGEIQEKASTFDASRSYLQLAFDLTSARGEHFNFTWCFTERSPKFGEFLLAVGGRRLPSGNVQPPKGPYIGQKVTMTIGQRTAKGAKDDRRINEVLGIYRLDEAVAEPPAIDGSDDDLPAGLR